MGDKEKILIVDDEDAILRNLEKLFGRDYHIMTARSAEDAIEILKDEQIHVVISDYKMTGQDGLSFLIEVKSRFPLAVRALMTAYADMNLVVRAMNEGEIHRFISKPFRYFEFRAILDECLRLSGIRNPKKKEAGPDGKLVVLGHDSQMSLSTLQIILTPTYRTLPTANGLEVLGFVSENKVDALVLGVGLEMLDGCTITSYLKKGKKAPFPIIIWSRDITGPFEEYLGECGADAWIDEGKPEASKQLRKYLQETLS